MHEKSLTQSNTLIEKLNQLKAHSLSEKQMQKLDQHLAQINSDTSFKSKIEKINLILTNNLQEAVTNVNEINYALVDLLIIELKKYLANFTIFWNNRVIELFSNKKTKSDDEIKSPQLFNESTGDSQLQEFVDYYCFILFKSPLTNKPSTNPKKRLFLRSTQHFDVFRSVFGTIKLETFCIDNLLQTFADFTFRFNKSQFNDKMFAI
ncbi:hypothetical protein BpHYR1_030166, partial [Brachionus plicatilis]